MEFTLEEGQCKRKDLNYDFEIKQEIADILNPKSYRTLYIGVVTPLVFQLKEFHMFMVSPNNKVPGS